MPRLAALNVLEAIEQRDAYSNVALDAELQRRRLDPRDAGLATEIVYGVLKHRPFLDKALTARLDRPLMRLDPPARAALRVGAYQLLLLDRVPPHAAISETVAAVKRRAQRLAGLVNAVLRRVDADRPALRAEHQAVPMDAAGLGLRYGLPTDLAAALMARFGLVEAIAYAAALQEPAPLTLRIRDERARPGVVAELQSLGLEATATRFSPTGLLVRGPGRPSLLAPVAEGRAVVQDEGSQLCTAFADPQPGWDILDLCAGRGGKTFHLDDLVGPGRIRASDGHRGKLQALERERDRLGLTGIEVIRPDVAVPNEAFDLVLVDAPCSGSGNLRRHPELRWKLTEKRIGELCVIQRELLERALRALRPGGLLVYVVCSDLPAEGPAQVEALLGARPDLARAEPPKGSIDWGRLVTAQGDLSLTPHRHGTDGFYAARLRVPRSG